MIAGNPFGIPLEKRARSRESGSGPILAAINPGEFTSEKRPLHHIDPHQRALSRLPLISRRLRFSLRGSQKVHQLTSLTR
jgi:hypothetical protein